jgi:hypothetical protein
VSADQRAWLATGVVRRLLLRAVLVLGGAFAVTFAGWLLCGASAHADVLPSAPSVPSLPSVLSWASSDMTAVPQTKLDGLSTPDVAATGRHARIAVTGVGELVATSVTPAADVLSRGDLVPLAAKVGIAGRQQPGRQGAVTKGAASPSAHTAAQVSPALARPRQSFATAVQRRHLSEDVALAHRAGSRQAPADGGHHSPALPPLQPAGSPDSGVHGGVGVASGSGMQVPFTHLLGKSFIMAGVSSTPRLTAGPGRQPGTSPD